MDSAGLGGGNLIVKPYNFCHCRGKAFCKYFHLALQVHWEGVRTPPADNLDVNIGDVVLVERHGAPRAKFVGANLVKIEHQALEADIGGMEAEEGDDVSAGDAFRKRTLGDTIGSDGVVSVDLV